MAALPVALALRHLPALAAVAHDLNGDWTDQAAHPGHSVADGPWLMLLDTASHRSEAALRGSLEELLGEFNITRLRAAPAMALSGGERRRVEIARALAANPSIMLLDEPFAGIDPISIADIRALVVQLRARDIGVLITDHNVRETLEIVNRACIIYDGRVLFEGTPEALVADETVRRVYLGEDFTL
jgi:lipopolysaccharide export system ATP-binding protein